MATLHLRIHELTKPLGVQLFLLIAGGSISGKLLDMGYFRITTIVGTLLYSFSYAVQSCVSSAYSTALRRLFMVSIAHTDQYYQLFLAQGIGMGLGAGMLYVPALAVQSHHFRVYKPLAVGVLNVGAIIVRSY